jgi:hypothetical protein
MKRLTTDAVVALFWLAMTPVYVVVRRALRDDREVNTAPPLPWLLLAEEQIEVWEPHDFDCRMMRP